MASAMIHLAVAKTLEQYLDIKNPRDYYLGSIAPDISKQLGDNKQRSHFLFNSRDDIPNLELFREKYPNFKDNSFDLGYYIHLYTDRLWFAHFLPLITNGNYIKLLDGTVIFSAPHEMQGLLYQDYTNLNVQLIDEYKLDLSLFYEDFIKPETNIQEIPVDKLNVLIDKMGVIIENSTSEKPYAFDLYLVLDFIDKTCQEILESLKPQEEII